MKLQIEMNRMDLLIAADALESRRDAYRRTAAFFRGDDPCEDFIIEEVTDDEEADAIADQFDGVLGRLHAALEKH